MKRTAAERRASGSILVLYLPAGGSHDLYRTDLFLSWVQILTRSVVLHQFSSILVLHCQIKYENISKKIKFVNISKKNPIPCFGAHRNVFYLCEVFPRSSHRRVSWVNYSGKEPTKKLWVLPHRMDYGSFDSQDIFPLYARESMHANIISSAEVESITQLITVLFLLCTYQNMRKIK